MKSLFVRFADFIKHDSDNKRFIGAVACIVVALAAGLLGPVPGTDGDVAITVGLMIAGLGGALLILLVQAVVSILRHDQAKQVYFRNC